MKKAIILFVLSLFTNGAVHADVSWKMSDDGTLTIFGTKMDDYELNNAPWSFRRNIIKKVIIKDGVTNIGEGAFCYCRNLTSITIPNTVESIGKGAFAYCSSLVSITIPNSVTSIGISVFYDCSSLTSITIPNSVTNIGIGFLRKCPNLNSIKVEPGNAKYDSRNNCNAIIETKSNTLIVGCGNTIIPNSVTSIGNSAFDGCSNLASIIIPKSVTNIRIGAFQDCSDLTSIIVENGNAKYDSRNNCNAIIETQSNMLIVGCGNTIIPNSVTSIGNSAFDGCTDLTSITIPNSVKSIGVLAFNDCYNLTSITIPKSVINIGDAAFQRCTGLTSLKVEEGNAIYDSRNDCNAIIETGTNTLIYGCKNTVIPNSVTAIGQNAFWGCLELTSIVIPDFVTAIGPGAFSTCIKLSSISIPNSVNTIGQSTFYGCSSLISITLPSSLQSIGPNAFLNSISLKEMTCYATTPPSVGEGAFRGTCCETGILYVPASSVSAYRNASGWNEWGSILPIEENATTSIDNIVNGQHSDERIYNLNGQRINRYDTRKGVYVKNGKKYTR